MQQGISTRRSAVGGAPEPVRKDFGSLTIHASRTIGGGYAINIFTGAVRHSALGYTTSDRDAYRARYRRIAELALAGNPAEQIADIINGAATEAVQAAERVVVKAFAALADQGRHGQVRPTMGGAHLAPVSEPLALILVAAHGNGGTVRRSKTANVVQLKALARKGLVTLNYEQGRGALRVVESATLTARGARQAVNA